MQQDKPPTLWILAGEPSGDTYGARLASELQQLVPGVRIQGMGGQKMRRSGVEILVDSSDLAVVGLAEVAKNIFLFRRIFRQLRQQALSDRPEAVILIDYPGFNLRFAAAMHRAGIAVVYYVSPQVWAWGRRRIDKIARYVSKMLVLFPFEIDVFARTDLDVEFVGHPLLEILDEERNSEIHRDQETILLLPGSRINELRRLLPDMLAAAALLARRRPELKFVISLHDPSLRFAVEDEINKARRQPGIASLPEFELVSGRTRYWLQKATAGIAASGTVTMEAAILGLPLIVVYRLHPLTYWLARKLVKVPYITMPNLIAEDCVYEELIQGAVVPQAIARSIEAIMPGGERAGETREGMQKVVELLGCGDRAGHKAARAVLEATGLDPS